jgi:phosphopantothenoylcysteine decarboxylase/phosphopantothenate--cysteine ligase
MQSLNGKRIILGVTGGIAAYKTAELLRLFQKQGAEVRVTLTASASRFIGEETFKTLSRHPVAISLFSDTPESDWSKHIQWGEWADLFVIAPCTANTLSKLAGGASDNVLTAIYLAARCPVLLCPTMDGGMYEHPSVKRNLKTLKDDGVHIIEPETGYLASGLEDKGRLPELETIGEKAVQIISGSFSLQSDSKPLSGKHVIVTAGATREFIDPVRFISNPSSGKMGAAMAKASISLGATVTFIHAHIDVEVPAGVKKVEVTSANDLFEAVKEYFTSADLVIMSAAVSDYTPKNRSDQKIKKSAGNNDSNSLELVPTPDILQWLGENNDHNAFLIGFAMETEKLLEHAQEKLEKKKCNVLLANQIGDKDSKTGFRTDTNQLIRLQKDKEPRAYSGQKDEIALEILADLFNA